MAETLAQMTFTHRIKAYVQLTKPGIVMGNALTAFAGFALASTTTLNLGLLLTMLVGLCLIMAAGCVCNNFMDRVSDGKMARTQGRALVTGNITLQAAKLFAALLGLFGALVLALFTNPLALSIALLGLFVYLALYSTLKYRSVHATLVGSIAGATPPVVGYCALANQLDMKALWLFAILVLWQMPHFYAIALYRLKEYSAAQIPVLPVVKGLRATKIQMALYILAFVGACPALALLQPVGLIYFFVTLPLGILWLLACKRSLLTGGTGASLWGRQMFLLSLGVIVSLCVGIYISVSFWSGTAIG